MQLKCSLCPGIATETLHGYPVCKECHELHTWAVGLIKIHWEVDDHGKTSDVKGNHVLCGRRRSAGRGFKSKAGA